MPIYYNILLTNLSVVYSKKTPELSVLPSEIIVIKTFTRVAEAGHNVIRWVHKYGRF